MAKKFVGIPKFLASIDSRVESAEAVVMKKLPYKKGHEAYESLEMQSTQLADGNFLVFISYTLKPSYREKQAGPGSYETEMERRIKEQYQ